MKSKIVISLILLLIILSTLTIFTTYSSATTYRDEDTGITWAYTLSENNEATNVYVYSYTNIEKIRGLAIPNSIDGHTVISIGSGEKESGIIRNRRWNEKVYSIKVPNTVTTINDYAFYCSLELDSIEIPDSVTSIGDYAFSGNKLTNIALPDSIETIGSHAFDGCSLLSEIKLSNSIKTLSDYLFYNCSSLKEITIPNSVTTILNSTFQSSGITEIVIPDSVTSIGTECFKNSDITSITFSNNMTSIRSNTFYECYNLVNVEISENIVEIENNAFQSCSSLQQINIPSNVKTIGNYAFYNCSQLETLTIENGLKTIGSYAFANCINLKNLTLPDSIESIKSYAFYQCIGLAGDLIIPDSVTLIEKNAFEGCTGLTGDLTVGNNITTINEKVFNMCSFNKITLKGLITNIYQDGIDSKVTDIWIDKTKEEINMTTNMFTGTIHYKGCLHSIEVSTIQGITIIDSSTQAEIISGNYECYNTELRLHLNIENSINKENLKLFIINVDESGNETLQEAIDLSNYNGETYNFGKVTSNKKISIINIDEKADLSLRMFISEVNGKELAVDRETKVDFLNNEIVYNQAKTPVVVQKNDIITYTIRVYNEGGKSTKVNEISVYIPEGLELIRTNSENINWKWETSEDKSKIVTTYLKDTEIEAYSGVGIPKYGEIKVYFRVTAEKQIEDQRIVNIAEITSASEEDANSNYGSITANVDSTYKYEESINSTSTSYIKGFEDDDDFENILISKDITVSYQLVIKKIDSKTKELLNGAEFELLDEDKNVLKTAVTENGKLDFGTIQKPGEGTDIFYLKETKTPEGYAKISRDEIKIEVTRTIIDNETGEYEISVQSDIIETERIPSQITGIPIYTREQLEKIGSNEEIEIDGTTYTFSEDGEYELKNDIDLTGEDWETIPKFTGTLNGNNYKISNMKINIDNDLTVLNIGLFGELSGEISDLNLENVSILVENMTADIKEPEEDADEETKAEYITKVKERLDSIHVGALAGIMETGTIKNCKVSGNVVADSNSVGGLIGYSTGYILVTNCTNDATVVSTGSNVGGILGFANTSISVVNCINNGQIVVNNYNAGGIVGCAQSGEYAVSNVNIACVNSTITIVIENKLINDKYSLALENRDLKNLNLLQNGEFNIYNVEKNIKYNNVKLENGKLKVDEISINTLGTDTYYIEQTKALETYNKSNNYAKIIITKEWNGKTEEYEIKVKYEVLTKEEFDVEVATDESYSTSSSGEFFAGFNAETETETNVTMTATINQIGLINNTNNGAINGAYNIAGIIGKTTGNTYIDKCTSTINTNAYRAAGIVAEVNNKDSNSDEYIKINGCNVFGTISGNEASGIVGVSFAKNVEISNCENQAEIASSRAGGIIAYTISETHIDECTNKGTINANELGGGIVGFCLTKDNLNIENSTNSGEISSSIHVGGLVGYIQSQSLNILNSTSIDTIITQNGSSGIAGGIVGYADSTYINIEDSKSDYSTINAPGNTGGIIGLTNSEELNILNCSANSITINQNSSNTLGGIVAIAETTNIYIRDCKSNKSTFNSNSITGGILGFTNICETVSIDNCEVKDTIFNNENTDCTKAAIVAMVIKESTSTIQQNIMISNCEVENINIKAGAKSGIFGENDGEGTIIIDSCNVKQSNFTTGADFGGMLGISLRSTVVINNCNSENLTVNRKSNFGGLLGYSNKETKVYNSKVIDCTIQEASNVTSSSYIAGAVGYVHYAYAELSNILVERVDITVTSNNSNLAGLIGGGSEDKTIKDVNVIDCKLNNSNYAGTTKAGILGFASGNVKIENAHVKNLEAQGKAIHIAGIIGMNNRGTSTINNCSVTSDEEKVTYLSGTEMAGGIISFSASSTEINNVEVNNVNLEAQSNNTGGIVAFTGRTTITNVKLSNIVTDSTANSGGIVGESQGNAVIKSAKIENSEIKAGAAVGGIIGTTTYSSSTCSDIIINNVEVKASEKNTRNTYLNIGGVTGNSGATVTYSNITISGLKTDSSNSSKTGYSGGVLGLGYTGVISNVEISESTIINKAGMAGIAGHYNGTVDNATVKDVNLQKDSGITINAFTAGGIVANSPSGTTVKNSKIEKLNIEMNSGEETSPISIGGIVGFNRDGTIENNNVKNLTVNHTGKGMLHAGGIAGINSSRDITNCNIDGFDITALDKEKDIFIGGILGLNGNVLDCNASNIKINTTTTDTVYLGGIIGLSGDITNCNTNIVEITTTNRKGFIGGLGGILTYNKITNSNTDTVKINSTSTEELYVGGSVGLIESSHTNSNVSNIEFEISAQKGAIGGIIGLTNYSIENCNLTGGTINSTCTTGGVVGLVGRSSAEVKNSNVTGLTITNTGGYTGGIAGFAMCTIEKCDLADSTILQEGDTAYGTGGIVGHGSNLYNSYTYIKDCEVFNSNIVGYQAVGGIAGAAVPYIENASVINSNVNGYVYVGGLLGYGGDRAVSKPTATTDEKLYVTIVDSNIANTTIKGLIVSGYVSEQIGRNSHNGIEGEDIITNTNIENCKIIDYSVTE